MMLSLFRYFGSLARVATIETLDRSPKIPSSGRVSGTCEIVYEGHQIMQGACSGLSGPDTAFLTAETSGCSVELTWAANASATVKLSAYRNTCWIAEDEGLQLDQPVNLGTFQSDARCWTSTAGRLCFRPTSQTG